MLQRGLALQGHWYAQQRLKGGHLRIPGDGVWVGRRAWTITGCVGLRQAQGVILLRSLQSRAKR